MIYNFIKENKPEKISFKKICKELGVSSSGYFKNLKKQQEQKSLKLIEEKVSKAFLYHKGLYGYRKLFYYLKEKQDVKFSLSQVRLILKKRGLRSKTRRIFKPCTSQTSHNNKISERFYKSGQTQLSGLNQIWVSDITYLSVIDGGFIYLSLFLDAFSRKIVGWDLSSSLSSQIVLTAFYKALKTRSVSKGLIIHSDRGVQYTSKLFRDRLKELGFIQSMSRKGNCYDNAQCESCFSLLKRELGAKVYLSMKEAKNDIFEWIEAWYNTKRLHSALGYKSPVEFEKRIDINNIPS